MKSLLISSTFFSPRIGGISHLMSAIASALGPDQVCCLTGQQTKGTAGDENLGLRVYRRPAAFTGKMKYLRAAAWGAAIAEIMVRERPDIVQLASAGEGALGLWLRRWLGLPYVVYAHGNEVLNGLEVGGQLSRVALQQARRVLAVSRYTADLVQSAGVSPDRIEIVHPGCDTDYFRPLAPRLDLRQKLLGPRFQDRVILTVGALVPRKGHDMVIRALPRLNHVAPNVTYLVVGQGRYRTELENLATNLGVRDRVVFAGRVSVDDLPHVYALSDVFVMASREQLDACDVEGFGLVFLEASACAKPVVGGRSGGIPDAIVDGVTGLLVDSRDPEDISNALARVLTDRDFASRLGQQGRSRAVDEFGWARVADRVQGILAAALREHTSGSRRRLMPSHPTKISSKIHESDIT